MFDQMRLKRRAQQLQSTPRTDELTRYLSTPSEPVDNPIAWWYNHRHIYPRLSRMALDYLSIPGKSARLMRSYCFSIAIVTYMSVIILATSVAVERFFSQGRILLSHVRNRLSAELTRAVLCVGQWSKLKLVTDEDVLAVTAEPELEGEESISELTNGWDHIAIS